MNKDNLRPWQFGVAIFGSLIWVLLAMVAEKISAYGWHESYRFISGYFLGFIIAFSGFAIWEIVQGRGHKFLDDHPVFRWLSYLMFAFILLFGLVSLIVEIFGNTNWAYNIGSLIGGVVVGIGVAPTFEKL